MFTTTVDLSGFRRQVVNTISQLENGIADGVRIAADAGAVEAKQSGRFKNRTGFLRANIVAHFERSNGRSVQWAILSRAPYSRFIEYGTRPHEIRPKDPNGTLRWVSGGVTRFARVVHHPGTRPDPYMAPGQSKAEEVLYRELRHSIANLSGLWN